MKKSLNVSRIYIRPHSGSTKDKTRRCRGFAVDNVSGTGSVARSAAAVVSFSPRNCSDLDGASAVFGVSPRGPCRVRPTKPSKDDELDVGGKKYNKLTYRRTRGVVVTKFFPSVDLPGNCDPTKYLVNRNRDVDVFD